MDPIKITSIEQLLLLLQERLKIKQLYDEVMQLPTSQLPIYKDSRIPETISPVLLESYLTAVGATLEYVNDETKERWPVNFKQLIDKRLLMALYPIRFEDDKPSDKVKRGRGNTQPSTNNDETARKKIFISVKEWNEQAATNNLPQPKGDFTMKSLLPVLASAQVSLELTLPEIPKLSLKNLSVGTMDVASDDMVLVGFYRSAKQLRLILDKHIYHFREEHFVMLRDLCQGQWPRIALLLPTQRLHVKSADDNSAPTYCFELAPGEPQSITSQAMLEEKEYRTSDNKDRRYFAITAESRVYTKISNFKIYRKVDSHYWPHIFLDSQIIGFEFAEHAPARSMQAAADEESPGGDTN